MALTIDWPTKVINVPKDDMLLVQSAPTEIRELDIDAFRLELKSIEGSVEGMPFLDTHSHNPPVTVGGVTLARVVEIINGYTVTFEDDQYAVNLVGANSNIADVTNVNQVSVRSANSAGLTYSKEIEDQSFIDGRVWLDTINGAAGTQFPLGTPGDPSSNLTDTKAIISSRALADRIHFTGDLTLGALDSLNSYDIRGRSHKSSTINFGGGDTTGLHLTSVKVKGALSGEIFVDEYGEVEDVTGFLGEAINCELGGTIVLGVGDKHEFINCYSGKPGFSTPIIDCDNLSGLNVAFRGYDGGLELRNISSSDANISVDLNSGHLILHSSVTLANDIVVRGSGYITDNSGVAVVPNIEGLSYGTSGLTATESAQLGQIDTLRKLMQNRMEVNPTTGIMTIYDDDDVSVFLSCNIYEDVLGAQLYSGRGIERRDRLA